MEADKITLEILSLRCLLSIKMACGFMIRETFGLEREIWETSGEVTAKFYGAGEISKWKMESKGSVSNYSEKHPCLRGKRKRWMLLKETKKEWDRRGREKKMGGKGIIKAKGKV